MHHVIHNELSMSCSRPTPSSVLLPAFLVLGLDSVMVGCTPGTAPVTPTDSAGGEDSSWQFEDSGPGSDSGDSASSGEADWRWPVAEDPDLGLGLNDTFGPRIQTSAGSYDFHRGIDVSRDVGTQVVAVADGEVTIAGEHASYRDTTVQIRHLLSDGTYLISHYTHLSGVEAGLEVGDIVLQGAPIGLTGQGSSSYPHLHFELRRSETGSSYQRNAVHPLGFLPYLNLQPPTLTINEVSPVDDAYIRVDLTVSTDADETDLVSVFVEVTDASDGTLLSSHRYDMNAWNAAYEDVSVLDEQTVDGVYLSPEEFSDEDYPEWVLQMSFLALATPTGSEVEVEVTAEDALGLSAVASIRSNR